MFQKAIDLFRQIEKPDKVNTLLLFNACSHLQRKEALDLVKQVSSKMPSSFYTHSNLTTSLIDVLMKFGEVEMAQTVFHQQKDNDLSKYSSVISGTIIQS